MDRNKQNYSKCRNNVGARRRISRNDQTPDDQRRDNKRANNSPSSNRTPVRSSESYSSGELVVTDIYKLQRMPTNAVKMKDASTSVRKKVHGPDEISGKFNNRFTPHQNNSDYIEMSSDLSQTRRSERRARSTEHNFGLPPTPQHLPLFKESITAPRSRQNETLVENYPSYYKHSEIPENSSAATLYFPCKHSQVVKRNLPFVQAQRFVSSDTSSICQSATNGTKRKSSIVRHNVEHVPERRQSLPLNMNQNRSITFQSAQNPSLSHHCESNMIRNLPIVVERETTLVKENYTTLHHENRHVVEYPPLIYVNTKEDLSMPCITELITSHLPQATEPGVQGCVVFPNVVISSGIIENRREQRNDVVRCPNISEVAFTQRHERTENSAILGSSCGYKRNIDVESNRLTLEIQERKTMTPRPVMTENVCLKNIRRTNRQEAHSRNSVPSRNYFANKNDLTPAKDNLRNKTCMTSGEFNINNSSTLSNNSMTGTTNTDMNRESGNEMHVKNDDACVADRKLHDYYSDPESSSLFRPPDYPGRQYVFRTSSTSPNFVQRTTSQKSSETMPQNIKCKQVYPVPSVERNEKEPRIRVLKQQDDQSEIMRNPSDETSEQGNSFSYEEVNCPISKYDIETSNQITPSNCSQNVKTIAVSLDSAKNRNAYPEKVLFKHKHKTNKYHNVLHHVSSTATISNFTSSSAMKFSNNSPTLPLCARLATYMAYLDPEKSVRIHHNIVPNVEKGSNNKTKTRLNVSESIEDVTRNISSVGYNTSEKPKLSLSVRMSNYINKMAARCFDKNRILHIPQLIRGNEKQLAPKTSALAPQANAYQTNEKENKDANLNDPSLPLSIRMTRYIERMKERGLKESYKRTNLISTSLESSVVQITQEPSVSICHSLHSIRETVNDLDIINLSEHRLGVTYEESSSSVTRTCCLEAVEINSLSDSTDTSTSTTLQTIKTVIPFYKKNKSENSNRNDTAVQTEAHTDLDEINPLNSFPPSKTSTNIFKFSKDEKLISASSKSHLNKHSQDSSSERKTTTSDQSINTKNISTSDFTDHQCLSSFQKATVKCQSISSKTTANTSLDTYYSSDEDVTCISNELESVSCSDISLNQHNKRSTIRFSSEPRSTSVSKNCANIPLVPFTFKLFSQGQFNVKKMINGSSLKERNSDIRTQANDLRYYKRAATRRKKLCPRESEKKYGSSHIIFLKNEGRKSSKMSLHACESKDRTSTTNNSTNYVPVKFNQLHKTYMSKQQQSCESQSEPIQQRDQRTIKFSSSAKTFVSTHSTVSMCENTRQVDSSKILFAPEKAGHRSLRKDEYSRQHLDRLSNMCTTNYQNNRSPPKTCVSTSTQTPRYIKHNECSSQRLYSFSSFDTAHSSERIDDDKSSSEENTERKLCSNSAQKNDISSSNNKGRNTIRVTVSKRSVFHSSMNVHQGNSLCVSVSRGPIVGNIYSNQYNRCQLNLRDPVHPNHSKKDKGEKFQINSNTSNQRTSMSNKSSIRCLDEANSLGTSCCMLPRIDTLTGTTLSKVCQKHFTRTTPERSTQDACSTSQDDTKYLDTKPQRSKVSFEKNTVFISNIPTITTKQKDVDVFKSSVLEEQKVISVGFEETSPSQNPIRLFLGNNLKSDTANNVLNSTDDNAEIQENLISNIKEKTSTRSVYSFVGVSSKDTVVDIEKDLKHSSKTGSKLKENSSLSIESETTTPISFQLFTKNYVDSVAQEFITCTEKKIAHTSRSFRKLILPHKSVSNDFNHS